MKYIPDLKELAEREYDALIIQSREPKQDFNEWYTNSFLPALYYELGKELNIFK